MSEYKVSIIILDYMKAKAVVENVRSLKKQICSFKSKIFVVDNSVNEENALILSQLFNIEDDYDISIKFLSIIRK